MKDCYDVAVIYTDGSAIPSPPGTGSGIYGYFYNKADLPEPAYRVPGIAEALTPRGFTKAALADLPILPDDAVTFIEGIIPLPHSDAQVAELVAFLSTFRKEKFKDSIPYTAKEYVIYSDSTYLINTYTQWIDGWAKRGWLRGDGTPCANRPLLEAILEIKKKKPVLELIKIPAHSGWHGNEMADALAKRASGMSSLCEGNYTVTWNVPEVVVEDTDEGSGESLLDAGSLYGEDFFDITEIDSQRYCYLLAGEPPPTAKVAGEEWHYMLSGNHAKNKDDTPLVGKLIPDTMFAITFSKKPVLSVQRIADYHEQAAWQGVAPLKRFHPICLVNVEMMKRKKFAKIAAKGLPVDSMIFSSSRNEWMYDDLVISRLLRPALLSYRTLDIREELLSFLSRAVEGHKSVVMNDITELLYPDGKASKTFYRNVDRSFKHQIEFPKGKCKIPVVMAKGIDMPDRTGMNRIKEPEGRFYIAAIRPEHQLVRYALVYIGKNYHGLWCGYYSASRILTEEEAK